MPEPTEIDSNAPPKEPSDLGPGFISVGSGGNFNRPQFARTREELADLIGGYDAKTISRWLKIAGNPGRTADNRYDVDTWDAWVNATGRRHGRKEKLTKLDYDTRIAALKQEQLQRELARERGETCTLDEACTVMTALFSAFVNRLRDLRHDVVPALVGETVPEATKRLGNSHDALLSHLSLGEWAKKKLFWSNASARLCALQRKSLPSTGP